MSSPLVVTKSFLFLSLLQKEGFDQKTFINDHYESFGNPIIFKHSYFPMKKYYSKEMGNSLARSFILFPIPIERENLIAEKIKSLEYEKMYSLDDARQVNVDPGLISLENVILSTFKSYSHRIYLDQGVFAELTYQYQDKSYAPLDWTYPDYRHEEIITFFNWSRQLLLTCLNQQ